MERGEVERERGVVGEGNGKLMRTLTLVGGIAFILTIMAFPAIMIVLSEDARLQRHKLQASMNEISKVATTDNEYVEEQPKTKLLHRRVNSKITRTKTTTTTHNGPLFNNDLLNKNEEMVNPAIKPQSNSNVSSIRFKLGDIQCGDEICESELTYVRDLFENPVGRPEPCDDFYEFVCGPWKSQNPIPEHKHRWSVEDQLMERIEGDIYWFLGDYISVYKTEAQNKSLPISKLNAFMTACLDMDRIDLENYEPFKSVLRNLHLNNWPYSNTSDSLDGASDRDIELEEIVALLSRSLGINAFVSVYVHHSNLDDEDKLTLHVTEPTMVLRREEYLDSSFDLNAYRSTISQALALISDRNDTDALAEEIVELEQMLAEGIPSSSLWAADVEIPERYLLQDLPVSNRWNWETYLAALFDDNPAINGSTELLVRSTKYMEMHHEVVNNKPKHVLLNYLGYRAIIAASTLLPKSADMVTKLRFKASQDNIFFQNRWRLCLREAADAFDTTIRSLIYADHVKKHSSDFSSHMNDVSEVISALSNYMTDFSRSPNDSFVACSKKLHTVSIKAFTTAVTKTINGDFEAMSEIPFIDTDRCLEGHFVAKTIASNRRYGLALNKTNWHNRPFWRYPYYVPKTFYDADQHTLELPLTLFKKPFFYGDKSVPFGESRVNFRVARELLKMCPPRGVEYDSDNERGYWRMFLGGGNATGNDVILECLAKMYSDVAVAELNSTLNGIATLPENLVDNMVLDPLFDMFRLTHASSTKEHRVKKLEGNLYNRIFFITFALGFCENIDTSTLRANVIDGTRVPAKYRVNIPLMNMRKFSSVFECPVGSPMNPTKKCNVWGRPINT